MLWSQPHDHNTFYDPAFAPRNDYGATGRFYLLGHQACRYFPLRNNWAAVNKVIRYDKGYLPQEDEAHNIVEIVQNHLDHRFTLRKQILFVVKERIIACQTQKDERPITPWLEQVRE